jgi:uncharacterized protein YbbC (DUF1343 family)
VVLYPALGLLEGTNLSVGRGTQTPFEVLGAPWIDGAALAQALEAAKLGGVGFSPATFMPESSIYRGETCHGVKLAVTDRVGFDPVRTGIVIARALFAAYPSTWAVDKMRGILGSEPTLDAIRKNESPDAITRLWEPDVAAFRLRRAPFLLY